MKKIKTTLKYIVVCLLVALSLVGCVIGQNTANDTTTAAIEAQDITENPDTRDKDSQPDAQSENGLPRAIQTGTPVSLADIPAYDGTSYIQLENNMPDFTEEEKKSTEAFERYSDLDSLGRCGQAYANICPELQPTEERGTIGNVRPSGWHTVKYNDLIDGNYLYNRCHLIAYCLAGENANEKNLITGTRYLNVDGMLPFEEKVDAYVKETGNHVLYRVTPILKEIISLLPAWRWKDGLSRMKELEFVFMCTAIMYSRELGSTMRMEQAGNLKYRNKHRI